MNNKNSQDKKKIMAISSGGGHWIQLMRLRPAFKGNDIIYVSVNENYGNTVDSLRFYTVNDGNRDTKVAILKMAVRMFQIVRKEKPDVILSTGAAPGLFGLFFGKLFKATTIWVDSIANTEKISLSGKIIKRFTDLFLTQWEQLADSAEIKYYGAII